MSTKTITSLQRSVDALQSRIGTSSERQQDREMVQYLRGRIAEIQDANKKRSVARKQTDQKKKSDPRTLPTLNVPEDRNKGNHRSRKAGDA